MKLRDKDCNADVYGYFPTNKQAFMVPQSKILNSNARSRVPNRPLYLIQYAHFLADLYSTDDGDTPEIYVYVSEMKEISFFRNYIVITMISID